MSMPVRRNRKSLFSPKNVTNTMALRRGMKHFFVCARSSKLFIDYAEYVGPHVFGKHSQVRGLFQQGR